MIALIAAMAKNRVIGKSQQMPWHLPADLAHFKKMTMGKPILMGRKTFESIGKPLPGRRNLVITRQDITIAGCEIFHSLEEALNAVANVEEVMVIGGGDLFQQALPRTDRLYFTFIDLDVEGDTFFPEWSEKEWKIISNEAHKPDAKNPYAYRFVILERL